MANAEARTATQELYRSFWRGAVPPEKAIAFSMEVLAEGYEKPINPRTFRLYVAALEGLTQEQIILAFSRATEESRFFPSPSTLLEYSGRAVTGDPIAAEAKTHLLYLLEGMRGPHGPTLKDIPGRVLYGTEDDPKDSEGNRVVDAIRAESTHFPLSRRLEAALVRLGWGDRSSGIAVVAEHPALKRQPDPGDSQYRVNQLRAADEILKRFVDAYREV